jgi:hypothetical protein
MNTILLKICLFSVMMLSGYQHLQNKKIVIIGKAESAMEGAVVIGPKGYPYHVDGVEYWDKKYYGKKVRVSGVLVIQHFPMVDSAGRPVQATAEIRTIVKPKWELVE